MTPMVWTHVVYVVLTVGITVWVGRTLNKHGKVFASNGNEPDKLTDSFAHLLEVGFYLLSFGTINIALKYGDSAIDAQEAIELLSTKLGFILLALGALHLMMMVVFANVRRQSVYENLDNRGPKNGGSDRFSTSSRRASV